MFGCQAQKTKLTKNIRTVKPKKSLPEQITVVTLRIRKDLLDLIDKERTKYNAPRGTWLTQAAVEKLEKLGYEIE